MGVMLGHQPRGLGAVAANDSAALPYCRMLPPQSGYDKVQVEVSLTGGSAAVTLTPVYVDPDDPGLVEHRGVAQTVSGEDTSHMLIFDAMPGRYTGFRVSALTGTITHKAAYGRSVR